MADLGSTTIFGDLSITGEASGTFYGNGSGLTSLNASNLSSGTVADARLPSTATRWPTWSEVTSKPSTFPPSSHNHDSRYVRNSARQTLAAPSSTTAAVYGVEATNNAGTNATVIRAVMSSSNTTNRWLFEGVGGSGRVFTVATNGTITGNGSGLTSLNASNLSSGTVANARLPTNARGSRTVSTGNPSGGSNGDIWLKY